MAGARESCMSAGGGERRKSPAQRLRRAGFKSVRDDPQEEPGVIAGEYKQVSEPEQPSFGGNAARHRS